jgi:photosystem II stability/assembly factor-like uncharacterized protein
MKIIKFFALLLLFQSVLFSQSGWVQQNSGTDKRLLACYFLNDLTGYAGGDKGTILKTTNGGNNWNSIYNENTYNVVALTFINSTTGWVYVWNRGSENNQQDSTFILKTVSGGLIWNKYFVDTNIAIWDWGQLQFFNANTGFLASYQDLRKTTNGGINWHVVLDTPSCRIFFINESTGWASGHWYGVFKTINGGLNWERQELITQNPNGADFYFFDSQKGYGIAKSLWGYGRLYSTVNGGNNWNMRTDLPESRSIQFVNLNTGYMLIRDNIHYDEGLAKTSNGGINWITHNINTTRSLSKVYFSSANTGWIIGDSGTILKTTNGGITIGINPVSKIIPKDFSLSQNYPNPFNPTTKIRFDIPQAVGRGDRSVKMRVYDLLGRELSVLVNEELNAGTYEVDFDGSDLPSGVYYYKLATGSYTQTKKMVLLK